MVLKQPLQKKAKAVLGREFSSEKCSVLPHPSKKEEHAGHTNILKTAVLAQLHDASQAGLYRWLGHGLELPHLPS